MSCTVRPRLDQSKCLRYSVPMALVADPQVPEWFLSAIQGSPAACAIVLVGYMLRGALNKHWPAFTKAISMLAVAIQAATVTAQERPITQSRVRTMPTKKKTTGELTPVPRG